MDSQDCVKACATIALKGNILKRKIDTKVEDPTGSCSKKVLVYDFRTKRTHIDSEDKVCQSRYTS